MKTCPNCKVEKHEDCFYEGKTDVWCKECKKARQKAYRAKRGKDKKKDVDLQWRYGITLEDWNEMFAKQKGCCAICGIHQSDSKRTLHTDHCHETGAVRGLLCWKCNPGLGNFNDDIQILEKAIAYLKENKK